MLLTGLLTGPLTGPLTWRKSTYSNPHGECVELARLVGDRVAVRNSREPSGVVLVLGSAALAAFLGGIKDGEFGISDVPP